MTTTIRRMLGVLGTTVAAGLVLAAGADAAVADTQEPPRLMINGGEPIDISDPGQFLYAYADCPGAAVPSTLRSTRIGQVDGWARHGGDGFWAPITVIDSAAPGTYGVSTTCSDGSIAETTYTLVE